MTRLEHLVCLSSLLGFASGLYACDSGGDGSSGGNFTVPDSGFSSSGSSGSSGTTTDDGSVGDAGGDSAVDEPTTTVTVPSLTAGNIRAAASAAGPAMVITVATSASVINFSFYEPTTGWTAGAPVPGVVATGVHGTSVALDGKGNAFLAWTQGRTVGGRVGFFVARYDRATHAWGTPVQPDAYAEDFGDYVGISANATGDALAVVTHSGGTLDRNFVAARYDGAAGTWSSPDTIQAYPNGTFTDEPEVHLTDNGKAVAYLGSDGAAFRRDAAGTWTPAPLTVPGLGVFSRNPNTAINEAGDVLVGYQGNQNEAMVYRYDSATASWVAPAQLSAEMSFTGPTDCLPAVGLSENGDGIYTHCFEGNTNLVKESYAFTKATGTWSPVTVIAEQNAPINVSFAFDRAGNGLVVHGDSALGSGDPSPAYFSVLSGGTWSAPSALGGNVTYPSFAFLSPNGRGFAAWNEGTSMLVRKVR